MSPARTPARSTVSTEIPMIRDPQTLCRRSSRRGYAPSVAALVALVLATTVACKRGDDGALHRLPPVGASSTPAAAPAGSGASARAPAPGSSNPSAVSAPEPLLAEGAVRLTGNTESHRRSLVNVAGQGLLAKLLVREGDFVKKGEVIAQLDPTQAGLTVRLAEAGLAVAKAQLRAAERERKRLEGLAAEKAVPGMQVDQATTGFELASAGVAASEAQVAQARKALADTTVRAPFAGIIGARIKAEGEWVSPMPPAPIVELVEVTPLDLQIQAPEHLLGRIAVGDEVTAHFNTVGRSTKAKVTRLVPVVRLPMRTFLVVAEIPNEDRALSPGLFAEIELVPSRTGAARGTDSEESRVSSKDASAREVAP